MKNLSLFAKIFAIVSLVLIVVGFTLFGIFGFNQDINDKTAYELEVKLEIVIDGDYSSAMKQATDGYLADVGINHNGSFFQSGSEGGTIRYKFNDNVSDKLDLAQIKTDVETAIAAIPNATPIEATVKFSEVEVTNFNQNYMGIIGAAVALVAIFIYLLFVHKLPAAVSVIVGAVVSVLLYIALVGCTRIFASDFVGVGAMISAVLTGAFTVAVAEKCRAAVKNVGNDKLSYFEIANKAVKDIFYYAIAVCALVAAAGVALAITVSVGVGVQLVLSAIVPFVTAYALSGYTWALVSDARGDRKVKNVEKASEVEEDA